MDDYIKREELRNELASLSVSVTGLRAEKGVLHEYMKQYRESVLRIVDEQPSTDVVSKEEYSHLLQIASKMHLWIFLHTGDEQKAYDEIGLTEEDNAILGYSGQFEVKEE